MNMGKVFGLSVLLLALSGASFLTYSILKTEPPLLSRFNIPKGAKLDIALSYDGKTNALVSEEDGNVLFAEKINGPYTLDLGIHEADSNLFRDLSISYRPTTGTALILAKGFSSNDTIKLSGGEEVYFDWSGKIELTATSAKKPSALCIETSANISFCHTLPARPRA